MFDRTKYQYQSDFARKYYGDGVREATQATLERQISIKFGVLSAAHKASLDASDLNTLNRYLERILTVKTLKALFCEDDTPSPAVT